MLNTTSVLELHYVQKYASVCGHAETLLTVECVRCAAPEGCAQVLCCRVANVAAFFIS